MTARRATIAVGDNGNAWPSTLPNTLAAIGFSVSAFPGVPKVRDIEAVAEGVANVSVPQLQAAVTSFEPADTPGSTVGALAFQLDAIGQVFANGDGGAVQGLRGLIATKAGTGGWPVLGTLNPATDPLLDLLTYLASVT